MWISVLGPFSCALLMVTACGAVAAQAPIQTGNGRLVVESAGAEPIASQLAAPGNLLLVNDARTANASLAPVPLNTAGGSQRSIWLPPGFSVSLIASGLRAPRFMVFDEAGNLLVAAASGAVHRLLLGPDGSLGTPRSLVDGLNSPTSLALHDGYLYVGETTRVTRYPYAASDGIGRREDVVPNLPSGGHQTRTVVFGPDGALYVSVGSSCNICEESDARRAAILRFGADGSGGMRFASGLRNAVGLALNPRTGQLWATVNERDNQGNEIPPDLVTAVNEGDDFGWPSCQPPDARPQSPGASCAAITPPTVGIQAHSAPLGLTFVAGGQFPFEYQNDLIVAQHGSWNREPPAAPKLLRIHFENGQPVSAEDFAAGWQGPDGGRWGRPAGVIAAPDGSLVVSDDTAGLIYRISYTG